MPAAGAHLLPLLLLAATVRAAFVALEPEMFRPHFVEVGAALSRLGAAASQRVIAN